jgi:hypothetical protein
MRAFLSSGVKERRVLALRRAVGVDDAAVAGADRALDRHRRLSCQPPFGSMRLPSPARTELWVVIAAQPGPGPPWGQTPEPSPARTFVVVCIVASWFSRGRSRRGDTSRCLRPPGRSWWCASSPPGSAGAGAAVGTESGAFGRADVRGGVHRRLLIQPGPGPPWGHIPGPSAARTFVVVCIVASWFSRGRSRRGDRSRCLRPPGRGWWCAWTSVAVRVSVWRPKPAAASGGADLVLPPWIQRGAKRGSVGCGMGGTAEGRMVRDRDEP